MTRIAWHVLTSDGVNWKVCGSEEHARSMLLEDMLVWKATAPPIPETETVRETALRNAASLDLEIEEIRIRETEHSRRYLYKADWPATDGAVIEKLDSLRRQLEQLKQAHNLTEREVEIAVRKRLVYSPRCGADGQPVVGIIRQEIVDDSPSPASSTGTESATQKFKAVQSSPGRWQLDPLP